MPAAHALTATAVADVHHAPDPQLGPIPMTTCCSGTGRLQLDHQRSSTAHAPATSGELPPSLHHAGATVAPPPFSRKPLARVAKPSAHIQSSRSRRLQHLAASPACKPSQASEPGEPWPPPPPPALRRPSRLAQTLQGARLHAGGRVGRCGPVKSPNGLGRPGPRMIRPGTEWIGLWPPAPGPLAAAKLTSHARPTTQAAHAPAAHRSAGRIGSSRRVARRRG